MGWYLSFSHGSMQSTFQYCGQWSGGHRLYLSLFNELCRCYLQQWGLDIGQWRATYKLCLLGWFPQDPIGKKSVKFNPFLIMKTSFGDKGCPVGSLSPPFLQISFRSPAYMFICQEAFIVLGFHTTHQMVFNLTVSPIFPSLFPPNFILPFQVLPIYP